MTRLIGAEDDLDAVIERYTASWYASVDHISEGRVVDGRDVPVVHGAELVEALRENVDDAKFNRDGIRRRYEQAQRDGLFDLKRVGDVSHETREKWLLAVDTMKGDKGRCISELRHWREYLGLALKGELPELKRAGDAATLIRDLAEAKS